jgi:transcriptional regulator with XRE-family HTH domain
MRFAKYLTDRNHTDAEFAALIGVTRQAVHRYKAGERIPDQATMTKIFEVTGGAVTPNDFFNISEAAPAPDLTSSEAAEPATANPARPFPETTSPKEAA